MMKKNKKFNNKTELNFMQIIKQSVIFSLLYYLISIALIAFIGWIFYSYNDDPTSKIQIISLIIAYFSSFIMSFIQSKINRGAYFVSGLSLGIIILALSLIFSLFFPVENTFSPTNIIWRCIIPAVCILGSALGGKRKNQRSHHYRRT